MDHNQPNNSNMASAHMQSNGDLSFNNFIDDSQAYADEHVSTTDNGDFNFTSWDPNLFNGAEQPAAFRQPQPTAASQLYAQNISRQSQSPALPQFGTSQTNYQNQYSQSTFDPRHLSQPSYDNHFMSRMSPSPGPYSSYSLQQQISFPSREQNTQSPQAFNIHQASMQQRPQSAATQAFAPRQSPGPGQYFSFPRVMQQQQYAGIQNREVPPLSGFPEQNQQPSSHFVNPSMLNANDVSGVMNGRSNDYQQAYQARQPFASSPYLASLSAMGSPLHQQLQSGQQQGAPPPSAQTGVLIPQNFSKPTKPKTLKDPNAPKRPRGRPRKDGTMTLVKKEGGRDSSSTSETDSDDGLEIDNEPPEPRPALLVVTPPSDLGGKALYDAVQAVWAPRNKPAVLENIRNGVKLFGEAVKSLRDQWKIKNENLRKAELPNSADLDNATALKLPVSRLCQNMETLMQRSLQHGHPAHLMSLGENPHTMSALYSFLLDRFNASDFDGSLVLSILRLVVKFTTMDQDMLEKTKNIKILEKLTKKAGVECKSLAQGILDNAAAATAKKKTGDQKVASPASPRPSIDPSAKSRKPDTVNIPLRKDPIAGVKRTRESESISLPVKRPVTKPIPQASKPLAVQAAERKRAEIAAQAQAAKTEKSSINGAAINAVQKPKIPIVAPPKPTSNIFSALQSASKKPGTSNAARAAAATKEKGLPIAKKESPPPAAVPAKPTFSFLDTLADMSKPKEVEQKKTEDVPLETEEERTRRLRKEGRRKLRVSWKPDDSLVETKTFTHDPDEEIGHADSMMRDVSDIGGEGRMLKLHMDKKGLEDEDEDGEELETYTAPSETDFGDLDAEERGRNFIKMGGTLAPESASSQAQARHEENTLMAVYALPSDVPLTPKEPPQPTDEDDYQPESSFGEPEQKTRDREAKYISMRPQQQAIPNNAPSLDLNALLQTMRPAQSAQQQPAAIPLDLQRTLSMLSQQQQQQPQQPQQPQMTGGGIDFNKLLAVQTQLQALQQPQYATPPPQAGTQNLAALLAQMQQPQALPLGLQGNPNLYTGSDSDSSRKHSRNESGTNDYDGDYKKNGNKKKKGGGGDGSKPYNYKTMTCVFWQKGQCTKGDLCTYKHEEN